MTRPVPDTSADVMNMGAMIELYQKPRLIWSPKIQAVIECSMIAAGSAIHAITALARSSRRMARSDVPVPNASQDPRRARSARVYSQT